MKNRSWGSVLGDTRRFVQDDTTRIPTGFPTLDSLLRGGFRPGHIALLIGRTEVGKSSVANQFMVNAASKGWPTMYASLEMGREEVALRALSAHLGASVEEIEKWLTMPEPASQILEASRDLRLLSIDDTTKPTWESLGNWVEAAQDGPKLVVIDHLKLMGRYGYPRGEAERVQQLAEDAKGFAKQYGVALVVIHQTNRSNGEDHGHKPLSMESSMYGGEQDADYIIGIHRPARDPELKPDERLALRDLMFMQLLKNRHGPANLDGIPLLWQYPSVRIEEIPLESSMGAVPSGNTSGNSGGRGSVATPDYLGSG